MQEHQQTQQSKTTDNTSQKQTIPPKQIPTSHPASIIQRARINPKSLTTADVLQLQRTIGNRAVGKLLSEIGLIPSKTKQASPVQMQTIPEEEKEPLQGMMAEPIQRQEISKEEEPLQGMFESESKEEICPSCIQRQEIFKEEEPLQKKRENNTGMPDNLKAGVESLSGIDMSDVRVHYNSDKPAEVGALAYTQGTNIHVAPGQEKHLPHEAWHVVQQALGRVRPTIQIKDVEVNDDKGLEQEADAMGEKASINDLNSINENSLYQLPYHGLELVQLSTRNPQMNLTGKSGKKKAENTQDIIDLTEATVIKTRNPQTLKHGNWYYKVFTNKSVLTSHQHAQAVKEEWVKVSDEHIPVPQFEVLKVRYQGKEIWAFRTMKVQGESFKLSNNPHKLYDWIDLQNDQSLLEKVKSHFVYAYENLGDIQGLVEVSDGGNVIFIDINSRHSSSNPACSTVIGRINNRLQSLANPQTLADPQTLTN
jgi:hypothetical protein